MLCLMISLDAQENRFSINFTLEQTINALVTMHRRVIDTSQMIRRVAIMRFVSRSTLLKQD